MLVTKEPRGYDVADRLRELRREEGLTQEELAEAAGIHATTLNRIERSGQRATARTVKKIADVFGLNFREFMSGENPRR